LLRCCLVEKRGPRVVRIIVGLYESAKAVFPYIITLLNVGAHRATKAKSDVTASSTTAQNNNATTSSGERSVSDVVLLHLTARQHQTSSTHQHARTVNCSPADDHQQSATSRTDATIPTYDGKTASGRRRSKPPRPRQTHSSLSARRCIAAAVSLMQTPARKHCKPTPSPVNFHAAVTATKKRNRARPVRRTCPDDVTCRPAMTSRSRLPATTKKSQTSSTSSAPRCRVSKPDIIADTGFTPQWFSWLREVNRCLNPHRRHRWSD